MSVQFDMFAAPAKEEQFKSRTNSAASKPSPKNSRRTTSAVTVPSPCTNSARSGPAVTAEAIGAKWARDTSRLVANDWLSPGQLEQLGVACADCIALPAYLGHRLMKLPVDDAKAILAASGEAPGRNVRGQLYLLVAEAFWRHIPGRAA